VCKIARSEDYNSVHLLAKFAIPRTLNELDFILSKRNVNLSTGPLELRWVLEWTL